MPYEKSNLVVPGLCKTQMKIMAATSSFGKCVKLASYLRLSGLTLKTSYLRIQVAVFKENIMKLVLDFRLFGTIYFTINLAIWKPQYTLHTCMYLNRISPDGIRGQFKYETFTNHLQKKP